MRYLLLASCCLACVGRPVLVVTSNEIQLQGEPVLSIRDAVHPDYLNIPPLEDALRELKVAQPCAAIVAPAETRYALVKRLVFTCEAAGFHTVGFTLSASAPARLLPAGNGDGLLVLTPTELQQVAPGRPRLAVEDEVTLARLLRTLEQLERTGVMPRVVPAT